MSSPDLSVNYLGLKLANPVLIGSCPIGDRIEAVARLAEAGAAAVVLHSLFEEQVDREARDLSFSGRPESAGATQDYMRSVDSYVAHISALKRQVDIPVIASINGYAAGPWIEVVDRLVHAGADAIELNTFALVTGGDSASIVEHRLVDFVTRVKARAGKTPVAVKLSPFYSALPYLSRQLESAGADGLVLFNRFYQSDIDIESLAFNGRIHFSDSGDLALRLRWLSVLATHYRGSLACSGGVHTATDTVKALLSGAHAVQLVSAALRRGPAAFSDILLGLTDWMSRHGYETIDEVREVLNPNRMPTTPGSVRQSYIRTLRSFDPWENVR